jgi:hypothetical protein
MSVVAMPLERTFQQKECLRLAGIPIELENGCETEIRDWLEAGECFQGIVGRLRWPTDRFMHVWLWKTEHVNEQQRTYSWGAAKELSTLIEETDFHPLTVGNPLPSISYGKVPMRIVLAFGVRKKSERSTEAFLPQSWVRVRLADFIQWAIDQYQQDDVSRWNDSNLYCPVGGEEHHLLTYLKHVINRDGL